MRQRERGRTEIAEGVIGAAEGWVGWVGGAKGRKGEKQSVKWREESKRQRPLSIQAGEMEDGDVDR